jgi:hypothetical protein
LSTEITQEQTKDEFITACLADGTQREVCEARWNAAHAENPNVTPAKQSPGDYAALVKDLEMTKARLKLREDQLTQAVEIANRANAQNKAKDNAQKQMLVASIQLDSHFTQEELTQKSLNELQTIRLTLDKSMSKTFANVAADIDEKNRKAKPQLTAGYFDVSTKTWKGGV